MLNKDRAEQEELEKVSVLDYIHNKSKFITTLAYMHLQYQNLVNNLHFLTLISHHSELYCIHVDFCKLMNKRSFLVL